MRLKLKYDPVEAVDHLRTSDEVMAALIKKVGPCDLKLESSKSLFEAMLRSIVYQQLHGSAASAILGRVLEVLKQNGGPTAEALHKSSEDALRSAGLSRNKLLAARDLAAHCLDGIVPTLKEANKLTDEELEERLTQVRGIGPWTVHMLLIFHLGRPDVMPTGDFAVRLGFKKVYRKRKDPTPAAILKHARLWQPYSSVASWYLWRSHEVAG
jgi:3-methyladenine DNA glycosylase/8-oxoguanine DNA glycosylase